MKQSEFTDQEREAILAALETAGWLWEGDVIRAPHNTMYLTAVSHLSRGGLAGFLRSMQGRVQSNIRHRDAYTLEADKVRTQKVIDDTESLVGILEKVAAQSDNLT